MTGESLDKPMRLVPIHVQGHTVLGYNLVVYTYNYRCHIKYHIKESIIVLQWYISANQFVTKLLVVEFGRPKNNPQLRWAIYHS